MAKSVCVSADWSSPGSRIAVSFLDSAGLNPVRQDQFAEVQRLAREPAPLRSIAANRQSELYLRNPEAWLESQVRCTIEALDSSLMRTPIYGQVPAFAGGERGIIDRAAVEHSGRLSVLELKAFADLHLPL
ncbi:MAG: hypothetical protein DMG57_37510 [Acidobacteria bacterium]|nr:MAG: hypothetical protein DMG57_37510 [Acidobacteriota bacterium]